ncbi:hypothetical protein P153DRAFT_421501 [Dothidotthia symphoricarpi CBS 119687]|uniref:F-box domain-containing protein n=1 Tax=Dothidotthia symphoricarpi CBS 119687 TaxID=1392245 RepID=A0A6A6AKN8_9PLEO|nr:uncharacterized protein P153DRAFT_421501 [Dothidotthia symphoricarpi CBS 119687]KAF2131437.1 hypothetical protein P153DRAFT_421501 [Dothidotthia symphoricarpi CBS 119687]
MPLYQPSSTTAFNTLPIELNKVIAHELDTDKDIATFRLICRSTNDAIDADKYSFWRARFREKYAAKEGMSNKEMKRTYQLRCKQLRRGIVYDFFRGHKKREVDVLEVLKDLILESFQGGSQLDEYGRPYCKNQTHLLNFTLNSKMLLSDRRAPPPARGEKDTVNQTLGAVKLMCSHFLFQLEGTKHGVFAVEESQRAVYMPTNTAPIYSGPELKDVNMDWILHCLNFFRHHMMDEEVVTLFSAMEELSVTQKPSVWREPLRQGVQPLCRHWKGTYSFLDPLEIERLRKVPADKVGDEYFSDKNVDEGQIQSLTIEFNEGGKLRWPPIFEDRLQSLRDLGGPPIKTQGRSKPKSTPDDAKSKNLQFIGSGSDLADDFYAIGWLNALPDQGGIPGWQRITFMKHFTDDLDQVAQDNLWAYEGVVLPGGRIILGRWWFASGRNVDFDRDYNGPFIFWAVDSEPEFNDGGDGDGDE